MSFDDPTLGSMEFFQDLRGSLPEILTDFFQLISSNFVYMLIPMGLAIYLLWFRDRRAGDMVMVNVLTAVNLNRFLKNIVGQPRPWVRDPSVVPADGTNHSAGYSFPSGHCSGAAAGWGSVAYLLRRNAATVGIALLVLLIGFSRMYLGVHTPLEVVAGFAVGFGAVAANAYLLSLSYRSEDGFRRMSYLYMAVFLPICMALPVMEDYDLGKALLGVSVFYGYFAGRHLEHLYVPAGVCVCDPLHSAAYFVLGILPIGAAVLLLPMVHETAGMAVGGAFAGLWISLLYPLVLRRLVRCD